MAKYCSRIALVPSIRRKPLRENSVGSWHWVKRVRSMQASAGGTPGGVERLEHAHLQISRVGVSPCDELDCLPDVGVGWLVGLLGPSGATFDDWIHRRSEHAGL